MAAEQGTDHSADRQEQLAEQQERAGLNEALFRAVNEQLERLNGTFSIQTGTFQIVCECGDGDCVEQLVIPTDDYKRLRSDPALFILVDGHQDPDMEAVVEGDGRYAVVRKHPGSPADIAANGGHEDRAAPGGSGRRSGLRQPG